MGNRSYALVFLLGVAALTSLWAWSPKPMVSAAEPVPTPPNERLQHQRRLDQFPTADYNEELPADATEREMRIKINHRYDGAHTVPNPPPRPEITGSGSIPEGGVPLPALPVDQSNLIVIGRVVGARRHLSNDKTGMYSEFDVEVREVLKTDQSRAVRVGQKIAADQEGGSVRYPNGQTYSYLIEGVGFPEVGEGVLLFLTANASDPNYQVLTGYELFDTYVLPLRGSYPRNGDSISSRELLDAARRAVAWSMPSKVP